MSRKVCIKRTGWHAESDQCGVTNIPSMSLSLVLCALLVTSIEACFQLPAPPTHSPPSCPLASSSCVATGESNVLTRQTVTSPRAFNCSKRLTRVMTWDNLTIFRRGLWELRTQRPPVQGLDIFPLKVTFLIFLVFDKKSIISAQVRVPGAEQLRGEKPAWGGERLQGVQPGAQQTEPLQQARNIMDSLWRLRWNVITGSRTRVWRWRWAGRGPPCAQVRCSPSRLAALGQWASTPGPRPSAAARAQSRRALGRPPAAPTTSPPTSTHCMSTPRQRISVSSPWIE